MKKIANLIRIIGLVCVMLVNTLGCTVAPMPTLTSIPVTAVPREPTMTPMPTSTPSPTATPLPPQPPRLLNRSPARGEEIPPDASILLRFDQAMDAPSLEQAWRIEPEVKGKLTWDDPRSVRFTPAEEGFQRDSEYRVTITTTARSAYKLPLAHPIELRFKTVGFLEVTEVFPLPDSVSVKGNSTIRLVFNRPVVPLTSIQQQSGLPNPIEFVPAIQGKGSWVNTSIYSFEPTERLLPGTRYTARVRAGLKDTTGGILAKDYVWSFTTEVPELISVYPANKAVHVSPYTSIRLTFNQPMKPQATQDLFSMKTDKSPASVPGLFAWDKSTLIFTPTQALEMGATYNLRLEKGAPAATGQASIEKTYTWQFTVARIPEIVSITPKDGETNVDAGKGIEIIFSGPISRETVAKALVITPKVSFWLYSRDNDTSVRVSGFFTPSTEFTVRLTTDALGRYGHPLREAKIWRFRTKPYDPSVNFDTTGLWGTYNVYTRPVVYVSYRNVSQVNLALYTLPTSDFIALNQSDSWRKLEQYRGAETNLIRRWSQRASAPLNVLGSFPVALTNANGTPLAAGLYYLEVSAPETKQPARHFLVISDTNYTLKSAQDEVLVWATDLREGVPVSGVDISIYDGKGARVAEARTDASGVAKTKIPEQDPWAPLIVLAKRGNSIAGILRTWADGIEPWDFRLYSSAPTSKYHAYFYTDRRIYRPGQTVYFKGILRVDNDAVFSLPPAGTQVEVKAMDDQGREFWNAKLPINEMGTVNGEFQLSEAASLGYYRLYATYDKAGFGVDFQVAEYRKPEFQVQVTLDKLEYVHGDTLKAIAEANYFFGGPVANAQVRWRVLRESYYFDRWQGPDYYDFNDFDYEDYVYPRRMMPYGEFVTEGEGHTNAQGKFEFSVPADLSKRVQSQVYTLEASVIDLNNQEVSARSSAIVHKGNFYIGLGLERYVGAVGQEQNVRILTVDTQGVTRTQQALEVICYRHEWYSVQEKADDGNYYWTNRVRDTAVATYTVRTDNQGKAQIAFKPPEGGAYKILARGVDERKNEVRSSTYMWVSSQTFINWGRENHDRINLIADKKSYKPGEMAQILVPSPYEGPVTALLTIERGRILEHKLIQIKSNSELLSLPIKPEYTPNIYVSLVLVKGTDTKNPVPSFKLGYVMLPVSTEQKELKITITPDRSVPYKPRDQVTYGITVQDYRGQGVQAELSLQLVDLAVETLAGSDTRNIVQDFYRERGLGVRTASSLVISVDRRNLERATAGKGGGGGGPGEGIIRKQFPDTAFWAPTVRTDASGRASVTVQLPDNLTTWRMTAQGVTAKTEVGKAHADIVTSLDVMVRPVVPRFMVIGDRPALGAILHNNTKENFEMTITLEAQGVTVNGSKQTLQVPAGGAKTVSWLTLVTATEAATLRFSVSAAKYADAVELRLPVYHPSTAEIVGTSGQIEEQIIELVQLPEGVDPSMGELTVQLEPSLAAGMREGLNYLKAYPYDCIEQTVSRFLPNIATYRALRQLNIKNPELEKELPQQVGVALQRLYNLQNLDGGWGWWRNESSSPILTAYVILGLTEARRADFSVDKDAFDRAIAFLRQWLDQESKAVPEQLDNRAAVLYALAEAGQGDLGRSVALFDKRANLALFSKAYLAMTLKLLAPNETSRLNTLANELADAAILSSAGSHWEEKRDYVWAMNTNLRTTALILRMLVRIQPDSSLIPATVRWLMWVRNAGRWENTQENAWAILALTDYMVASGELLADYDYLVWLNGSKKASGSVSPTTVDQPIRVQASVKELRLQGDNALIMERTVRKDQKGTGKLYYSAFLRYFVPADRIRALSRGIIVDRQYYLATDPKKPISEAKTNDTILVKLTLIAPHDLYYLVMEDPLPAGCEAIDTSLKTTSVAIQPPELMRKLSKEEQAKTKRQDAVHYWASHSELRDEKVALFASYVPKGTYEYAYALRCTTPGEFKIMPAMAYEMYAPDVFGRSAGTSFVIAGE